MKSTGLKQIHILVKGDKIEVEGSIVEVIKTSFRTSHSFKGTDHFVNCTYIDDNGIEKQVEYDRPSSMIKVYN